MESSKNLAQTTQTAKAPRNINILDRLQAATKKGMVLDVSALQPNGIGSRSTKLPSEKSRKIGVVGLDIISNNPDTYILAINLLEQATGLNYKRFIDEYRRLYMSRQNLEQTKQIIKKQAVEMHDQNRLIKSNQESQSRTRTRSLISRLQDATSKGKVLDVSNMDIMTGKNIKSMVLPGNRSRKIGVIGLNIISNNRDKYMAALQILSRETGNNYDEYIRFYNSEISKF